MKKNWCGNCEHCKSIETYNNMNRVEYFVVECKEKQINCLKKFHGFICCGEFKSIDNDKNIC